jgi:acyl-CoA thioester hydrolase
MTKSPDTKPAKHVLTCRVYYEDTDAGGLVYHANHLRFAERGRTEMLRSVGYDHHRVSAEFGLLLVVKNIEIDYKAPARLDDMLDIATEALTVGNTSLVMKQVISCQNRVLAELKVVVVAITPEGKPMRWPPQLRQIFLPSSPLAEA